MYGTARSVRSGAGGRVSRLLFGGVVAAWAIAALTCQAAEWTADVVRLQPASGMEKPPVVSALALHPDGQLVAIAGDDHRIRVWDLASGEFVQRLAAHVDWVRALAYSPTGQLLASAGSDGRILLWDAETGRQREQLATLPHAVAAIVFSHDGKTLSAIGFGDTMHVFDVSTSRPLHALSCPSRDMRALAYSPDRFLLAGAGRNGVVRLWNAQDGQVLQEFVAHRRRIWGLAFSPDGRLLASCGEDGAARVSHLDGQEEFSLEGSGGKLMSLTFCGPDQLATGGSDNLIRIWDLNRRVEIEQLSGHTGSVVTLAFSGNVLVSAGYDTTVRVWRQNSNLAEEPHRLRERVGARRGATWELP